MFGRRRLEGGGDRYSVRKRLPSAGPRRLRLHHVCTAFVALLCVAHVLFALLTIQHEEIWTTLTTGQVRTSDLSLA